MKIKSTDSFVKIGSSHSDCQDFAISGKVNEDIAYAILADGCSSSHSICRELDFGARLMCYSARKALKTTGGPIEEIKGANGFTTSPEWVTHIGWRTLIEASRIRADLDIHPYSLDTTLLVVISSHGKHHFFMYGDGCFIYKIKNDPKIYGHCIEFNSGAPFYLSYHDDSERLKSYGKTSSNGVTRTDYVFHNNACIKTAIPLDDSKFDMGFYKQTCFSIEKEMDFVAISSDGLHSFQQQHPEYPEIVSNLEIEKIAPEVFGYKNYQGQFVERRMKNFMKSCIGNKTSHYDDVSIASISFGD